MDAIGSKKDSMFTRSSPKKFPRDAILQWLEDLTGNEDNSLRFPLTWLDPADDPTDQHYHLDDFRIEVNIATELFEYFNTHYRRYIHFFQPAISAPNIFKRSPFLFWTMILISSRANEHHPEIHDELLPGFDKFLAPVCQRPIRQIETIHALLLLCLWPVPRPRTSKNPTQDYLSLARDTAMQLNCHQISAMDSAQSRLSGFRDRTAESAANEAKARTWLGYVYVDTLFNVMSGLPLPFSATQIDEAVGILSASRKTPPSLKIMIYILKTQISAMKALENTFDPSTHFRHARSCLDNLKEVEGLFASHDGLEHELETYLSIVRLYIISFMFSFYIQQGDGFAEQSGVCYLSLLKESYYAASDVVLKFRYRTIGDSKKSARPDGRFDGELPHVPVLLFPSLFNATSFLFRFLATFPSPSAPVQKHAINAIAHAHFMFQFFPKRWASVRAAIRIEVFMAILKQPNLDVMGALLVTSRLGASVMLDAIFYACHHKHLIHGPASLADIELWRQEYEELMESLPKVFICQAKTSMPNSELGNGDTVLSERGLLPRLSSQGPWERWDFYIKIFHVDDDGTMD